MRRRSPPRRGRRRAGEEEDAPPSPDRLSALPDALLHHVMSSLKAWEVVRTCVLARRWRNLWASAPCVDLRLRPGRADGGTAPEDFARFARRLFRRRDASAPVDTLRLRSSDVDGAFVEDDARSWIRTAVKRRARVVHLIGHRNGLAALEHAAFVSRHLKILKLSYAMLDDNILRQLSSRCPSLEEMDLKDCLVSGREISSSSLKTLAMVKCNMFWGLTINAPNLVLLRCVKPIGQAPSLENLGSLVVGTIVLDDYCFSDDFEDFSKDELDETTDDDDDELDDNRCANDGYDKNRKCKRKPMMMFDDDELDEDTDDDDDDSTDGKKWGRKTGAGYGFGFLLSRYERLPFLRPAGYKDATNEYGSDIESDDDTYEYSEIASDFDGSGYDGVGHSSRKDGNLQACGENSGCSDSKISGGHNIIHSLSNATSLELLADAGEVILTRELKSCPSFSNLKTLSLGEWSLAADFDPLVFFLQHSPSLEKLFLELKLHFNVKKPVEIGIKPNGRSFACQHLQMVKIKCSKDDVRVHKLAQLFKANGVSVEKIFVRRTGSAHLRGKKAMKDLARHELEFWGDEFWGDVY